jgi:hypothetical protein
MVMRAAPRARPIERANAEPPGVLALAPRCLADHHVVGLPGHCVGDAAAVRLDPRRRLAARQAGQRASQHEGAAGKRAALGGRGLGHRHAGRAQAAEDGPVAGVGEELHHRLRDGGADAGNPCQLAGGGARHPVQRPEAAGEQAGDVFAHQPDAERVEEPREATAARDGDGHDEVLGRLASEALEGLEVGRPQAVEVGEVAHELALDELIHDRGHLGARYPWPPRAEVAQPFLELGRARDVDTPPVRLALRPQRKAAAGWPPSGKAKRARPGRPPGAHDLHDVGNHVTGLAGTECDILPDGSIARAGGSASRA